MWRYVTGCLKDTLQRSANYFDIRCGAGLASNQQTSVVIRKENAIKLFQEKDNCGGNFDGRNTEKSDDSWYQCHLNNTWANAFSWSSAIILGWYASQVMCLAHKRRTWEENISQKRRSYCNVISTRLIHSGIISHLALAQPPNSHNIASSQDIINSSFNYNGVSPVNISNDTVKPEEKIQTDNPLDIAVNELTNVVSSIENKLGLAAIEAGNVSSGIAMLQSAADRRHAPAQYNLALCYERGLGTKIDEKMAMELYREAASQDHAAALYNLAVFHGQGRGGLTRDERAAEVLLRRAAEHGQTDARLVLANLQKPHPASPGLKAEYIPVNVAIC